MRKNDKYVFSVLLILSCSVIPISTQSLWGDEAWTITEYALKPTFKSLIINIFKSLGGDSQFPGYNVYLWIWVNIFGASEISVRLANIPPFYISLLYTAFYLPRSRNFKTGFLLLICLSPVIWFYLNESRYIIAVFSCSLLSLVSVILYFEGETKNRKLALSVLFASFILGFSFIMLYVFFLIPLLLLILLYLKRQDKTLNSLIKDWRVPMLISAFFILILGAYYYYTLKNGAGGTRLTPDIKNILYILYDFLGYGGIGPPRNVLRANPTLPVHSRYFIAIISVTLFYIVIVGVLIRNLSKIKDNLPFYVLLGTGVGMLIFFIFAKSFDFKFLSRHLIFFFPPFLFSFYTLFYDILVSRSRKLITFVISGMIVIFLYSDINIRFNSDYQKENYKKAIDFTIHESGNLNILWIADEHCFQYYTRNKKLVDSKKIKYLANSSDSNFLSIVKRVVNKDHYFIVVLNRKDYSRSIQNLLVSKSYVKIYKDQDFTIYK